MDKKRWFLSLFILGIILALFGAILMVIDFLPISARIAIGIVGVILIAISSPFAKGIKT